MQLERGMNQYSKNEIHSETRLYRTLFKNLHRTLLPWNWLYVITILSSILSFQIIIISSLKVNLLTIINFFINSYGVLVCIIMKRIFYSKYIGEMLLRLLWLWLQSFFFYTRCNNFENLNRQVDLTGKFIL